MSLLIGDALSVRYGKKVLFEDESFAISAHDRIGLVGPNGSGKSTLMKILAGVQQPDSGEVQLMRRARIGYLAQELGSMPDGPLVDAVLASVPGRAQLDQSVHDAERALAEATDEAELLDFAQQITDIQLELAHFEEHYGRHRAEEILLGLGFRTDQFDKPTKNLSGGWRMRAALASLLLTDPDLLLLDEPTNHLDVPTLRWFDAFLRRSGKALLLISHDRDFLNRQIDKVISFEPEGMRTYVGNYDEYKRLRAVESEQLKGAADRQARKRAEVEAFINRFRAKASKARQVKSREKALQKEDRIEVLEERKTVGFRFPEVARSGREVIKLEGIAKAYGTNVVYRSLDAQVLRGERIAIVGANGAGKTTLLKLIAGETTADAGTVTFGHNVTVGYYAQHHTEKLDPKKTVLEEVWGLVPDKAQSTVRGILGSFLFTGDDVDKPIAALSGGERARVALARLLVLPTNLILMDEPTNHLDLDSSEALIEALQGYTGTLLFVSHNRSFVNALATRVLDVSGGKVESYPGNLDDYFHHLDVVEQAALAAAAPTSTSGASVAPVVDDKSVSAKERRRLEAEARQLRSAKEKPFRDELVKVEKKIAALEEQKKVAETALADPELYADFERAKPHMRNFEAAKAELDVLYARWEELQLALETA